MLEVEGECLVKMAREAFDTYSKRFKIIHPTTECLSKLRERRGVFVRVARSQDFLWTKETKTLACLGYPRPSCELAIATIDSAVACAVRVNLSDSLNVYDWGSLLFEVSVLTKPKLIKVEKPIDYPNEIELGQDGLLIEQAFTSGLILPQVALECNYDKTDLLGECCVKAGLLSDSWLTSTRISVYKFQVEIFREEGADRKATKVNIKISAS